MGNIYGWLFVKGEGRHGARPEIQKIARVWDLSGGEVVATIKCEDIPGSAVFGPDARRLIGEDGTTLRILEVIGGGEVTRTEPISRTNGWREVRNLPISEGTLHSPSAALV
jgi:hypothetical protein